MAAELKKKYKVNPELIKGAGGVFEVVADGALIFSKKKEGRFPEHKEIFEKLEARK
ncbi:MAG: Rdx family protein [Planctomycetes bacterium]|nr:Rdx family protein [Planctomycetota bacterium]